MIVTRAESSATEIEEYWFNEDDDPAFDGYYYIDGDIDSTLHTVSLTVPYGTDITDLKAGFELSHGASAAVGGIPQESEVTSNNFTYPVTYTITAEDDSTQDWVVTVYITPPKTTTDIEEFEFDKDNNSTLPYDVESTIDSDNHTISLTAPYGIRDSLIAAFVLSDGATATVGATPVAQVSGTTSNDFSSPVTYTITAQDGTTTQDWTVTVYEEAVRYVCTAALGGSNSNNGSISTPWLTIQHALDEAPDLCTIIVMDDGPYNETIQFPSDNVVILKSASGSTVINGEGYGTCTVAMFGCPEGTTMEGFTITHASGESGRGIFVKEEFFSKNGSNVVINNCTISNNSVSGGAAGLWVDIGTNFVTLNDCTISNNTADGSGGGIYLGSQNSSLTLNNCTISGNQATATNGEGGGIYQGTGTLIINGCTISDNEAGSGYSAGICLDGGTNTIGGSGADMNNICGNFTTGSSATLDDQIGNGTSSLYTTYESTNNISTSCSL